MVQETSIAVPANGRILQLSLRKYSDKHVAAATYPSTEICSDLLVLAEGRTVANILAETLALHSPQAGPSLNELRDQACLSEFGKPLGNLIHEGKALLRKRYSAAHDTNDRPTQLEELRACARQGHVQANMDLGKLFDAEGNPEAMDYFGHAHNLGHPSSLLELSKTFLKAGDTGPAVRVLLLGDFCGSFVCAQALLVIRQHRLSRLETPACLEALEEWCSRDSLLAKYVLGCVLLHGESCRDALRGQAWIQKAAEAKSFKGGDKGRVPLVPGGNQFHAGTLADLERLIDIELSAIRSKELEPKFVAAASKLLGDPGKGGSAAVAALLEALNPAPERMRRRFDKTLSHWLEEGAREPVDEAKRARMAALASNEADASKGRGHE